MQSPRITLKLRLKITLVKSMKRMPGMTKANGAIRAQMATTVAGRGTMTFSANLSTRSAPSSSPEPTDRSNILQKALLNDYAQSYYPSSVVAGSGAMGAAHFSGLEVVQTRLCKELRATGLQNTVTSL